MMDLAPDPLSPALVPPVAGAAPLRRPIETDGAGHGHDHGPAAHAHAASHTRGNGAVRATPVGDGRSLVTMSAAQRVLGALAVSAVIWLAIVWALAPVAP